MSDNSSFNWFSWMAMIKFLKNNFSNLLLDLLVFFQTPTTILLWFAKKYPQFGLQKNSSCGTCEVGKHFGELSLRRQRRRRFCVERRRRRLQGASSMPPRNTGLHFLFLWNKFLATFEFLSGWAFTFSFLKKIFLFVLFNHSHRHSCLSRSFF